MVKRALKHTSYFFDVKGDSLGESVPVLVKKRRGARRITLRYQPLFHALSLTLPKHVAIEQALDFMEKKREWVLKQMEKCARPIRFEDGQVISMLGQNYRLQHVGGRGVVRIIPSPLREEGKIVIPGDPEFLARRVRDWLKHLARREIGARARAKAETIGVTVGKIALRDTRSLWGSCTRAGNLSFSWRLVLAPEHVLDYVVAHEVAHLKELNHSPRFWKVVEGLCPHWETSRRWLKEEGDTLHRYR